VMAIQTTAAGQFVGWEHYDASNASYRPTNSLGQVGLGKEMDTMGADAGVIKPLTWPQPTSPGKLLPYYGVPELNSATDGCVLDGIPVTCDSLTSENSKQCTQNQCTAGSFQFRAFADGYSGYLPSDARYSGAGIGFSPVHNRGSLAELAGLFAIRQDKHKNLPGTPDYVDSEKVLTCANDLFGFTQGGFVYKPESNQVSFQGYSEARRSALYPVLRRWVDDGWVYITPDNTLNSQQTSFNSGSTRKGGVASAYTDPDRPTRPYIANDISGIMHYENWVHELGNSLSLLSGQYEKPSGLPGIYHDEKIRPTAEMINQAGHDDPGVTFQHCVFGNARLR